MSAIEEILKILPRPANQINVAYITTASKPSHDKSFVEKDRKLLEEAGFNIEEIDIEGKNQKTLLSDDEEQLIINTFKEHQTVEDFTVVVSYEQIKAKNYSLSAGQYFDVKIEYTNLTHEEFVAKMKGFTTNLDKLFEESKKLELDLKNHLEGIKYVY